MWFRVCLGKTLTETEVCKQIKHSATKTQHTSVHPPPVFCATLFTVHSPLQASEAVSNATQIWISAVLCKFDSNYVCITELWNKSVCCGMWLHIPLLFWSIIVCSVCWVFISCGLFLFFPPLFSFLSCGLPPPLFFLNETPFLIKKEKKKRNLNLFLKVIWIPAREIWSKNRRLLFYIVSWNSFKKVEQ